MGYIMKLSTFIKRAKKLYPNTDPNLYVLNYSTGKMENIELIPKSGYYPETLLGNPLPKKDFICIEVKP
jgi:hypothetical protein